MNDFSTSFAELQVAVRSACRKHDEWPARAAAGIYAALDFAVANPGAAYVLAVDLRVAERGEDNRYTHMVEYFSELVGHGAPRDERLPALTDEAVVSTIVAVVADHLRSGRMDRLVAIAPDLVCLTLLPYLGFTEAKRWA